MLRFPKGQDCYSKYGEWCILSLKHTMAAIVCVIKGLNVQLTDLSDDYCQPAGTWVLILWPGKFLFKMRLRVPSSHYDTHFCLLFSYLGLPHIVLQLPKLMAICDNANSKLIQKVSWTMYTPSWVLVIWSLMPRLVRKRASPHFRVSPPI